MGDADDIIAETRTYDIGTEATVSSSGRTPSQPSPETLGRYRVGGRLGAGGMGIVYEAIDPALDRKVAVKLLRPGRGGATAHARMSREAQAMARLSHPNVLHVYDVGLHADQIFVAMEYVDGQTLTEWLASSRPWREVLKAFIAAGRGLAAAHEAGIVHRDFKPDNVLVDRSGRVMVTDFGLAQIGGEDVSHDSEAAAQADSDRLTVTGTVMGTPRYMSPEQHRGEPVDASTDQFAFCVALFEAMFGTPPFDGDSLPELSSSVTAGEINTEVVEASKIPGRVNTAILRGLQPSAPERHESMDALLDALDREAQPRGRRLAAGMAIVATIAVASLAGVYASSRDEAAKDLCEAAPDILGDAWTATRRAAVERAIKATDVPFAQDVWTRVERSLNTYEVRWLAARRDACEATHVRKEQSPAVLDLRMRCLADRKRELSAMTKLISLRVERKEVSSILEAVGRMQPASSCNDIDNLQALAPLPVDPSARARIAGLTPDVDLAAAEIATGRLQQAVDRLEPKLADLAATNYPPLPARATYLVGEAKRSLNRHADAQQDFNKALPLAVSAKDQVLVARVWIGLTLALGDVARTDEARVAAQAAKAAVLAAGSPAELQASLYEGLGLRATRTGNNKKALELWTKSAGFWKAARGEESTDYGRLLTRVGTVQSWVDMREEGLKNTRRGLAILKAALGKNHPSIVKAYRRVGEALLYNGDRAAARDALLQAVAIGERVFGPNHSQVAIDLGRLGSAYTDLGELDVAIRHLDRALRINLESHGKHHINTGFIRSQYGLTLLAAGKFGLAEEQFRRLVEIGVRVFKDPTHVALATAKMYLGRSLVERAKFDEARTLCQEAYKNLVRGKSRADATRAQICAARAILGKGRTVRAITELEAALKAALHKDDIWISATRARYWLGMALTAAGRHPARVRKLMTDAEAEYDENGYKHDITYVRVTRWLAARR